MRKAERGTKEFDQLVEAHTQLKDRITGNVPTPQFWGVLNAPHLNSFTVGRSIVVTTAALKSEYLPVLMAHEVGHLKNGDGITLLKLRRLVKNTAYTLGVDRQMEPIGSLAGGPGTDLVTTDDARLFFRVQANRLREEMGKQYGGIGLLWTWPGWADYWQSRDFLADEFVADIGLGQQLIELLEKHELLDVAQPYYLSGRPYHMERVGHLIAYMRRKEESQTQKVWRELAVNSFSK